MRAHPTRGPTCCRAPRSFHRTAEPPCEFHRTADPISSYFGTLAPCRPAHMRIARARNQAGRAKRSNGEAIAVHGAQKSRITREIRRRGPPDPPIPRPPNAWESRSLTTYRVFRTTSEKPRVSRYSAPLLPAVLPTEHEGVLGESTSDTKNVMDTTLTPMSAGENRVGALQLPRREAHKRRSRRRTCRAAPALKAGALPAYRFSLIRRPAR